VDDIVRPVHHLGPPHPEAAQNEPEAGDDRKPQGKGRA
jgi:hypothetical protein